ncbi:MAG: hypothetical protein GY861_12255 [bacterium]|nr:hypothetical protein [bacterium]
MAKKKVAKSKSKKARTKKIKRAVSKKSKAKKTKKAVSKKKKAKKAVTQKKKAKKTVAKKKTTKKPVKKIAKKTTSVVKSSAKANMLITYDPNHRGTAEAEINGVFNSIGQSVTLIESGIDGLFRASTPNPKQAVKALLELCYGNPSLFSVTNRYIPVEKWCESEIPEIQATIRSMVSRIGIEEKWKMGLNKRHWDKVHGTELIIQLTDVIDREHVDLVNPDKIVQVEIVGDDTGVSLLNSDEVLDVPKIKMY